MAIERRMTEQHYDGCWDDLSASGFFEGRGEVERLARDLRQESGDDDCGKAAS
jgi:hypothetical protein